MDVNISTELQSIYKNSRENYDVALMTLLDSLDPDVFQKAFDIIEPITLKGELTKIKIGNSAVNQIKAAFEHQEVDHDLIHLLLWIAVIFPEV